MHDLNDTFLVEKSRQDSKPAFREIYEHYYLQMYCIAKKYVIGLGLAEDAMQDISIKILKKREELDTSKSINRYLFKLSKNHVLSMIRDRKKKILSGYDLKDEHYLQENRTAEEIVYKEYQGINETINNHENFNFYVFK